MSEILICFCDFCNPSMLTSTRNGRGYMERSEEDVIRYFGWKRMPNGKAMCEECQDEVEKTKSVVRSKLIEISTEVLAQSRQYFKSWRNSGESL